MALFRGKKEEPALEAQLAEIGERLAGLDEQIQENTAEAERVQNRLTEVRNRYAGSELECQRLRADRQTALGDGKDATKLTKQIEGMERERGLMEDEAIGLERKLAPLAARQEELATLRAKAAAEVPFTKLVDAGRRYNTVAEQLAAIVREMWEIRHQSPELADSHHRHETGKIVHSVVGWTGALCMIPRLFLPGEEPPQSYHGCKKAAWFDLTAIEEELRNAAEARRRERAKIDNDRIARAEAARAAREV